MEKKSMIVTAAKDAPPLAKFDWDFASVAEEELIACCHFEFARESATIIAHYEKGAKIESYSDGLKYHATVDGRLMTLPNPFVWAAPPGSGLFSEPWQCKPEEWRRRICVEYSESGLAGIAVYSGFMSADSQHMKAHILSRGDSRDGIDYETGIERIAVEIPWAAYDNGQIVDAFKQWLLEHRPKGIGVRNRNITTLGRATSWRVKLDRLAIMRLLRRATLSQLQSRFPEAWDRYWPKRLCDPQTKAYLQKQREFYRQRDSALADFHSLFPFLSQEIPVSWPTAGGRSDN